MNNIVSAFFQKKLCQKQILHQEGTSPLPSPTVPPWRGMSGAGNKAS